jgi:hypothetical protein
MLDNQGIKERGKKEWYPESIFMWWALKKKTIEGMKVMSKYLT